MLQLQEVLNDDRVEEPKNSDVTALFGSYAKKLKAHAAQLDEREDALLKLRRFPTPLNKRQKEELRALSQKPHLSSTQRAAKTRLEQTKFGTIPLGLIQVWMDQAQDAALRQEREQRQTLLEKALAALKGEFGYIVDSNMNPKSLGSHILVLQKALRSALGLPQPEPGETSQAPHKNQERYIGAPRLVRYYGQRINRGRRLGACTY